MPQRIRRSTRRSHSGSNLRNGGVAECPCKLRRTHSHRWPAPPKQAFVASVRRTPCASVSVSHAEVGLHLTARTRHPWCFGTVELAVCVQELSGSEPQSLFSHTGRSKNDPGNATTSVCVCVCRVAPATAMLLHRRRSYRSTGCIGRLRFQHAELTMQSSVRLDHTPRLRARTVLQRVTMPFQFVHGRGCSGNNVVAGVPRRRGPPKPTSPVIGNNTVML